MNESDYEKMKLAVKADYDEGIAALNEEFRVANEHIEFVWRRFNGGLFNRADSPAKEGITGLARGDLTKGVRRAIRALGEFSESDVTAYLDENCPDLGASNKDRGVKSAVTRLNASGEIKVITRGKRGRPQTYKVTESFGTKEGKK